MKVEIYTKNWCAFCHRAKYRLEQEGIEYTEYDVTTDRAKEVEMVNRSGSRTVPQIFINGTGVGGSDDLERLVFDGRLHKLLNA